MSPLHLLPLGQSGNAFLLFIAGLISCLNGYSLLFDDRKLNRLLPSTLLLNSGAMLIFDSLHTIGLEEFENLKVVTLVCQVFIGLLSTFFIWDYRNERSKKLKEREGRTSPPDFDSYE